MRPSPKLSDIAASARHYGHYAVALVVSLGATAISGGL